MTLQQFFDIVSNNPSVILFYYFALPLTAFLVGVFSRGEGCSSPWKYVYSAILYACIIPGVFVILLDVYLFLFERRSIMNTNIYTQILPIIGMVVVYQLVRRKVPMKCIPGFSRLSGLVTLVFVVLLLMWLLDRTHLFAVTMMPFQFVVVGLIVLFIILRIAIRSITK